MVTSDFHPDAAPPPHAVAASALRPSSPVRAEVDPIPRCVGPVAIEARWRARVGQCRASNDAAGEREACTSLARLLAARDAEPQLATELARRALELGEDAELRTELAGWWAGLGDAARAAATLGPLVRAQRAVDPARVWLLSGVLLARAGDGAGAVRALAEARKLDPRDATASELMGTVAAYTPDAGGAEVAAAAYLEAASARERAGDAEGAFDQLLRAHAVAPGAEDVATRLSAALASTGRAGAADEVRRRFGVEVAARGGEGDAARARAIHLARVDDAVAAGDAARALGAAIDAGLDEASAGAEAGKFAMLLARAGGTRWPIGPGDAAAERPRALEDLARTLPPATRSVLLAIASELSAAAGDLPEARRRAEAACHADAHQARAVGRLAESISDGSDPAAASVLERAVAISVARARSCKLLADSLDRRGERGLALAWTQRWVSLVPGDVTAIAHLLRRAALVGDSERLAETLEWLLAQPLPVAAIAEPLAHALRELTDVDPARGGAIARRTLDAWGPRDAVLQRGLETIAARLDDRRLAVSLLERFLATSEPGAARVEGAFSLAERRAGLGDTVGEVRALGAALAMGASPGRVLAALPTYAPSSSDALVAWLEVRAEALAQEDSADREAACCAFRELGAARWDLAEDAGGAVSAWVRASRLDPASGTACLAGDLVAFGGHEYAHSTVVAFAETCDDQVEAAQAFLAAASIALDAGAPSRALADVDRAVALDPRRTEAVPIAERAAVRATDMDRLDAIYHCIARAALGCFGRRAAHYRAARELERRGRFDLALAHAASAFEQVPSEGTTFAVLARIAAKADSPVEAVRAVERVAEAAASAGARAAWLKRAATLAGSGDDGLRQRIDVLLRALVARADVETIVSIFDDAASLLRRVPGDRETLELRLERASRAVLPRLKGPEGARIALAVARGALDALAAPRLAADALVCALEADADLGEFAGLEGDAVALGSDAEGAARVVALAREIAARPYAAIGAAALKLAAAVARASGAGEAADELAQAAARRGAADARSDAADDLGDLGGFGDEPEPEGAEGAEGAVEPPAPTEAVEGVDALASRLVLATDARDREPLLRELARAHEALGETAEAAARWRELAALDASDLEAAHALERHAVAEGDHDALAQALGRRAAAAADRDERRMLRLRRAAILEQRLGRLEDARAELEVLLAETGPELGALRFLADLHERLREPLAAAQGWLAAADLVVTGADRAHLATRACHAFLAGGDVEAARRALALVVATGAAREDRISALEVEVERKAGPSSALVEALATLAASSVEPDDRRAACLVEAAHVALDLGDSARCDALARRALELAPSSSDALCLVVFLERRARGDAGDAGSARALVERLAAQRPPTDASAFQLWSFLRAEAEQVYGDDDAALATLRAARDAEAHGALVALGLAEHYAKIGDVPSAVELYGEALAGDLRGLRARPVVALAAARLAFAAGDGARTRAFAQATGDDEAARLAADALVSALAAPAAEPTPTVVVDVMAEIMGEPTPLRAPRSTEELLSALRDGDVEAGNELLDRGYGRGHPALVAEVRSRQADALPGDQGALERLRDAALAAGDAAWARAVEHVLGAFDARHESVPAPPIAAQQPAPEVVAGLVFGDGTLAALDALGIVCEGAPQLFRRDQPSWFGRAGVQRVLPGARSPLGRVFTSAAAALGLSQVPLFHAPGPDRLTAGVALAHPPGIVLGGDAREETPELRYLVGSHLVAAMPECALLFALPEARARLLFAAIPAAYGPPERAAGTRPAVATIAESLWQTLPARSERRLRELCMGASPLPTFDEAQALVRALARRAGLFVSGDLGVAVRHAVVEGDLAIGLALTSPGGLAAAAAAHPEIAALVRLAVHPRWAHARWQPSTDRGHEAL